MNRTHTACFALIASAFVLAAILILQIDRKGQPNTAQADGQVISQPAFTMMTARTRGQQGNGDESLFILDNNTGVLIVYNPTIAGGRKGLNPVTAIKMTDVFGGGGGANPR